MCYYLTLLMAMSSWWRMLHELENPNHALTETAMLVMGRGDEFVKRWVSDRWASITLPAPLSL